MILVVLMTRGSRGGPYGLRISSEVVPFCHAGRARWCRRKSWRRANAETPPEATAPLLWELGQLRKVAQDVLAHAARTYNLSATGSLLRAANGTLELLARIEKAKGEELKVQQATAALQEDRALEAEFNRKLDEL